jgi:hypothetical protein
MHRIRLLHRIAVDWVADVFRLRTRTPAAVRHDEAHARAYRRAVRWNAPREHRPPRVLRQWQETIGRPFTG